MKAIVLITISIIIILMYFPEPKNFVVCSFAFSSFNWETRICKNVTESFCENFLNGEFYGCINDDDQIININFGTSACKANCQTQRYRAIF